MNKIILITGSTDGIGKLAALKLVEAGHQVYLHGRDADKIDSVIAEVKAVATGAAADNISGFVAGFLQKPGNCGVAYVGNSGSGICPHDAF